MSYAYQWPLVAFSVFIAVFASYTTLRMAFRLAWASPVSRRYWIAGGACSMGIGIWAMHFVGMLALHLPVPIAYDPLVTAFSLLPAILASAVALYVLSRPRISTPTRFAASLLMGLGIVTMHYSGMAAMKMSPPISYDPLLFALSVLVAVGASWAALALVYREQTETGLSFGRRLASALAMGGAIAGMHYVGMTAADFSPDAVCTVGESGLAGSAIGLFVGLLATLVLAASLALTFYDEVVGENSFYKALLLAQSDAGEGVLLIEGGRVVYANAAMVHLSGYSQAEFRALASWTTLVAGEAPALPPVVDVTASVATPGPGRRELVLQTRHGEQRTCEAVLTGFRHAEAIRHLLVCIDITDRKAAEQALRAREAQARELALVAARTDNAVVITDALGLILWVNDGFEKITGYSLDEARGKKPGRLLQGPETDPAVRRTIREHLARGEGFEAELINYHKSGRTYWIAINVKPVHDDSGAVVKFIAIERDITERKQADAALLLSEARLKEAQQLARVGSWELDLATNEYIMSEEGLRIHELDPSHPRVPRETVLALLHPDDQALNRQQRAQAMASLGGYAMEVRLRFADGRIKHLQVRAAVQADTYGNPTRVVGTIQDITEQKQAEAALRASEAKLQEAQRLAHLGSFENDLTSNAPVFSAEALRIFEIDSSTGQVTWQQMAAVIHPDDLPAVRQAREQALVSRGGYSIEHRLRFADGRIKHVHARAAVYQGEQGQPERILGTVQDITDRVLAEQTLREREAQARELALVASSTDNGVIIMDAETRITWVNDGFTRMSGYTLDEVQGKPPGDVLNGPETDAATLDFIQERVTRGERFEAEIIHYHKSGRKYWAVINVQSVYDDSGRLVKYISIERDITSRKLAETALRKSEAMLQEAQHLARIGSWELDLQANEYLLSDEAQRIHELYAPDGRVSRKAMAATHSPEDVERLRQSRLAAMEHNGTYSEQVRLLFPEGRIKYVQVRGAVHCDEGGKPLRVVGTVQDISEQILAEQALRESEARLKEAQHLAKVGSWDYDFARGEYVMSEEAIRIHEFPVADGRVSRSGLAALIHPDDREILHLRRNEALARLTTFSVQLRLLFPDGRIKHVHLRGAVQGNAEGRPVRVVGTVQDVTEQRQAELALRELNETLEQRVLERTEELSQQRTFTETILNSAETLIFVLDWRGCFVRFNGACERLTGYSFEELRDQPIWEYVIPPERRHEVRLKHENQTSPEKLAAHLEVEWLTRDGRRRLISWSNAMITDATGRLQYMVGTGIDITERKRAETALIEANEHLSRSIASLRETQSQLVQAEKMASLGGLVAGISHEINTPIGIGVTSATTLQEEFLALRRAFDDNTLKRSSLERFIAHGLNGCDILVTNLLRAAELIRSFKQVAVDQSSDQWRELNLHDYIDEIVLSLKPRIKSSRVQVHNDSNRQLLIRTHPGAIYQILSNLLLNALIHAYEPEQAGTIRIRAEQVGDEIELDFVDDGKGIPAEIQGRIFDPFFTTRRGSGGSGLGLHIVFNLVSATLGGVIYLVNNERQGATFRIRFPVQAQSEDT